VTNRDTAVMKVDELAELIACGRRQTYEAIARGDVPGVIRIGRSIRVSRVAVARWLEGDPEDDDQ
jgi:excisionase family DNA binding protein